MEELKARYIKAKKRLFLKVYGAKLNREQCRAVFTTKGPLLVLAGAGSGKTTVLVNRISYIIKYGNAYFSENVPDDVTENDILALESAIDYTAEEVSEILPQFISDPCPPWNVLAITFTNKAAGEIKERLATSLGDKSISDAIWAGTFHSICVRILRKFGDRVGLRQGFSIYDADDSKRMISACMKELSIDEKRLSPKAVANEISRAKDRLEGEEAFKSSRDPRARDISEIYRLYTKKMLENNAVDFDDIIVKTVDLLKNNQDVHDYYAAKFKYVLVDEYQDTNHAQFVLTSLLSDKYRNIMVVGDDDQSIYRFRGATIENILDFDKTYPDATVVKLEQNYRSTETILDAANAVIGNNSARHRKKLWCDKGKGELITLRETQDQNEEGRYIIDRINHMVKSGERRYSDFAILYRVNELARSLETSFAKSGVPYKILGSMRFYDRKEIKDIIAYLSVVNSGEDNLRLKRIINEPKRKIGAATVDAIENIAGLEGVSMFEIAKRASEYTALLKSAEKLGEFVSLIESIRERYKLPSELINAVFNETGYHSMLISEGFEGEGKIANVNEFTSAAIEYEKRCKESSTEPSLVGFLEEISLISDVDKYDQDADAVVLMTIHAAKGLEFPIVFIAGMEDGIFPSLNNIESEEEMSEERRLAYVAITRAKDKLFVTHARNRMMYGKTGFNPLSRFIKNEVPEELIAHDRPRSEPPKSSFGYGTRQSKASFTEPRGFFDAVKRSGVAAKTTSPIARKTPDCFGVVKYSEGTRVSHAVFGEGIVVSAREMGGDILYEVSFDSGITKKLMATFAKLKKI